MQICLLLSYRKTYRDYAFESENFLLEASQHLNEANVPAIVSEKKFSSSELTLWERLYTSWAMRIIGITLGTKRTIPLKRAIDTTMPNLQISALDDDINFAWFLNIETKQRLAKIFIAKVALIRLVFPFCGFLIKASSDAAPGGRLDACSTHGRSILAVTEELEDILANWLNEYSSVFELVVLSDSDDESESVIFVQQSFLKLTYE